ncbi:MAG: PAAR domain-containing protein, partial [Methyloceanibacter sp.]
GDRAGCGSIVQGSPDVFINGKPAAVHGDPTGCGGSVTSGAASVFVNGKPMATAGDTAGCAGK